MITSRRYVEQRRHQYVHSRQLQNDTTTHHEVYRELSRINRAKADSLENNGNGVLTRYDGQPFLMPLQAHSPITKKVKIS